MLGTYRIPAINVGNSTRSGFSHLHADTYQRLTIRSRCHNTRNGLVLYKPAILSALKKWGVPYVDIEECAPPMGAHGVSELSDKYTIDGTHPNKAGYERFYMEPIAALLKRL